MANTVQSSQVDGVLRELLPLNGFRLLNPPRGKGETGADIIATIRGSRIAIECIGFQEAPPIRSKQFYESFFRAVSRLKDGVDRCAIALPERFGRGLNRRAQQYGKAWTRIGAAFPELEMWLVDVKERTCELHHWNDWPLAGRTQPCRIGMLCAHTKGTAGGHTIKGHGRRARAPR